MQVVGQQPGVVPKKLAAHGLAWFMLDFAFGMLQCVLHLVAS